MSVETKTVTGTVDTDKVIEAPNVIAGKGEAELAKLMKSAVSKIEGFADGLNGVNGRLAALEKSRDSMTRAESEAEMKSDQIAKAIQGQVESVERGIGERIDQLEAQVVSGPRVPAAHSKSAAQLMMDSDALAEFHKFDPSKLPKMVGASFWSAGVKAGTLLGNSEHRNYNPYEGSRFGQGQKAIATMGSAELGPLVPEFRRPTIAELLTEFSDLSSWVPRIPVPGTDIYEFNRETEASRLGYVASTLTAGFSSGAGAVASFAEVEGFTPGTVVRFHTTLGIETATILSIAVLVVTFNANLDFDADADDVVTSENYGSTAEEALKPGGLADFELVQCALQTLATVIGTTRQRIKALPQLLSDIETKMRMRARRNRGFHIAYGDTVSNSDQLAGWASEVGVQTYLLSSGPANDFRADAIIRAAALVHSLNQLVVHLNIDEWNTIRLEKSPDNGHYVLTSFGPMVVVDRPGMRSLGSMIINIDGVVQDGDFFVVDHLVASEWADQMSSEFSVGWINDDYLRNQIKLRYEEYVCHAILTTTGYVYGQMS